MIPHSFIVLLLLLPMIVPHFVRKDSSSSSSSSESLEGKSYIGREITHKRHKHKSYGGKYNDDDTRKPPRPSPRPTCEDGWTFFQRPSGGWCMKVFPGTLNQYNSETMCASKRAVLSGLQNTAEISWLVSSALTVIAPQKSGGVWIGARRRPECIGSRLTATCTKTSSFYWTDNSTTGIEGMIFQQGEPDNWGTKTQNCVLMTVATTPKIHAIHYYWSGQMDDMFCERTDASSSGSARWPGGALPRANRAYVCGKKARR